MAFIGFLLLFGRKPSFPTLLLNFFRKRKKAAKPFCNDLAAFLWSYWPDLNRRPADYESGSNAIINFLPLIFIVFIVLIPLFSAVYYTVAYTTKRGPAA